MKYYLQDYEIYYKHFSLINNFEGRSLFRTVYNILRLFGQPSSPYLSSLSVFSPFSKGSVVSFDYSCAPHSDDRAISIWMQGKGGLEAIHPSWPATCGPRWYRVPWPTARLAPRVWLQDGKVRGIRDKVFATRLIRSEVLE